MKVRNLIVISSDEQHAQRKRQREIRRNHQIIAIITSNQTKNILNIFSEI